MELKKINDFQIKPLRTEFDKKPHKHQLLFNRPYPIIVVIGRRNVGKTTMAYNILKEVLTNKTKLEYFTTTSQNSDTSLAMLKKLDKHKFEYEIHDSLYNDENENILEKVYEESKNFVQENYEKLKRKKYNYPIKVLLFDDFGQYLRDKFFGKLAKQSRHLRILTLIFCHYLIDLSPDVRSNIDFLILGKDIALDKLKQIHSEKISKLDLDTFINLYNEVTKEDHSFLYIDIDKQKYRKNFNYEIII